MLEKKKKKNILGGLYFKIINPRLICINICFIVNMS